MRRVLNSIIIIVWVFAQTMTAAHSHVHLPGHMMPAAAAHDHAHDHAMDQQGHLYQHQHAAVEPIDPMHTEQEYAKSTEGTNTGNGVENCCNEILCQSADLLKSASNLFNGGGDISYDVSLFRHDGRSPSFVVPPPDTCI